MNRSQKEVLVQDMADRLSRAKAVILTDFSGLTVEKMTDLRSKMRAQGLEYKVVKNTLLARASAGTEAEELFSSLTGPNGVAISYDDPVELAKVLADFAKENQKLELKQGLLEGKPLAPEAVKDLAKLPGREQLLAMLLGALNGVPRNFVSVLAAPMRDFMGVLKAIEDKKNA